MDKYAVWVKASERLPGRPGENERNCEVFVRNIKTGDKKMIWWGPVPQKGGNRKSLLIDSPNDWEWLDESPVDRGVEKAAEDEYPDGEFGCLVKRAAFIAGAKWAGNDAVEFAEWVSENAYRRFNSYKGKFWCDESEYEWMGEDDRLITTEQLYNLFKQKQL